jgi:hypothetical protein
VRVFDLMCGGGLLCMRMSVSVQRAACSVQHEHWRRCCWVWVWGHVSMYMYLYSGKKKKCTRKKGADPDR